MQIEDRQQFSAGKDKVLKMFSDRAFFERKYAMLGSWDIEVLEHTLKNGHFHIKCRFQRRSEARIPAFAQKFVGESVQITQEDNWDLATGTGQLKLEVKGLPMQMGAQMKLEPAKGGCVNVLSWNLHCGLPLIGGKLEKAMAEEMRVKFAQDLVVARKLLADY